jgi:hypothetical protein
MKKTLILLTCLLALALAASAQQTVNFSDLPRVSTPTPMPNGYGSLAWTDIFYVDPTRWAGSGPGYKDGLADLDVAFVGGKNCRLLQEYCYGSISSPGGPAAFQPVSALAAGGFGPTYITVLAYNNGKYVGSAFYSLNTQMQTLTFPPNWGGVTQLVFQTSGGGDLVFYGLSYWILGG